MAFLYGDGTASELETNYIEFLRDILDFSVQVLLAEHRVRQRRGGGGSQRRVAETELERLKNLSHEITRALDQAADGSPDSIAGRCVTNIRQSASQAIKKAAEHVKSSLTDELKKITDQVQRERSANLKALEKLLLRHDLPDSSYDITIRLDPQGGGYVARLAGRAAVKLEWVLDLAIPPSHIFGSPLKVERISPHLEMRVPERSGLVRKSMKLRAQKFASKYVTELSRDAHGATVKLRATPDDADSGYDVVISPRMPRVRLTRRSRGGEIEPPFEPLEEDCAKVLELYDTLAATIAELASSRRALLEARLDGKTLGDHEDPAALVSRLIDRMAPTVQEINRRSLSPNELVLKRLVGNDRREEIFTSKADLLAKIGPVPLELRGVFAPLGLGDLAIPDAVPGAIRTGVAIPPLPRPRAPIEPEIDEDEQTAVAPRPPSVILAPEEQAASEPHAGGDKRSIDVALAELDRESS